MFQVNGSFEKSDASKESETQLIEFGSQRARNFDLRLRKIRSDPFLDGKIEKFLIHIFMNKFD